MNELDFYREFFLFTASVLAAGGGSFLGIRSAISAQLRREQRELAARSAEAERRESENAEAMRIKRESAYAELRDIETILTARAEAGENPLLIDWATFRRLTTLTSEAYPYVVTFSAKPDTKMSLFRRDTGERVAMKLIA